MAYVEEPYYVPLLRCTHQEMQKWVDAGRILWTRNGYWDTKKLTIVSVQYTDWSSP